MSPQVKTVGIIGAGRIGKAVAKHAARAGRSVVICNSKGPDSLAPIVRELGPGVRAGTVKEAAEQDLVVLAVPWLNVKEALSGLPPWNGRVVVDATNAVYVVDGKLEVPDLGGRPSTKIVAELMPGARVVKGFNTLLAETLALDPNLAGGGRRVLIFSGDDEHARDEFRSLATDAGFMPMDIGSLEIGGQLQQFPGSAFAAVNLVQFP
jgi:hypothetical protein